MIPRLALLCLAALILAPGPAPADNPAPVLRDEQIVRLLVSGTPHREIIEQIRASDVDFDLSDEMVAELGFAGVPPAVIEVMRERQKEVDQARRAAAGVPPDAAPPVSPTLTLLLRPVGADPTAEEAPVTLRMRRQVEPGLVSFLGLDSSDQEPAELEDIALFLICRTQDHVPDHWRGASPLGRDFVSMPRHHLLHFHSGATEEEPDKPKRGREAPSLMTLKLPTDIRIDLAPDVPHDLSVGIAVQIAGRFYRLTDTEKNEVILGDTPVTLTARLGLSPDHSARSMEIRLD